MMGQNYSATAVATTLAGAINDTQETATVTDGTGWPTSNFVMTLGRGTAGEELVYVATRTGTALAGLDRGYGGTAPLAHDAGATAEHTSDAPSCQRWEDHLEDSSGAHAASAIAFTPTGNIAATTVQTAIAELDTEKAASSHSHVLGDVTGLAEGVRDYIGAALVAGDGIEITVDDPGDTITIHARCYVPGTYVDYAGTSAPTEVYPDGRLVLLPADGAAVSRTTYADLFAKIGTTYGAGNGTTTFNVPDAEDRMRVGSGGSYAVAATGGAATVTLSEAQMPVHTHTQTAHTHTQNSHTHTQDAHTHTQNVHTHTQDAHDHNPGIIGGFLTTDYGSGSAYAVAAFDPGGAVIDQKTNTESTAATNQNTTATNQNTTAINQAATATNQNTTAVNQNAGGGEAHNNMPPYLGAMVCIAT